MTMTAPARPATADGRGRLPAPVRDRRPALAALALLLVLGGALGSALIAYRSGDRVDVLVAREDIEVGQTMAESDFSVARVAADSGAVISAAAVKNFVGASAGGRIPAGTLLNSQMFIDASELIPPQSVVVGVVLSASQRPADELRRGDVVRVFLVPREAGGVTAGTVLASAVRVAEVGVTAGGDSTRLSLLIPEGPATAIVSAAATNSIAVTKLASDTLPAVDFRSQ
jgi:hypothetical protein